MLRRSTIVIVLPHWQSVLFVGKAHLEVFPSKELDTHDGEDEPEDEADQQDVEDARDGLDESIYYNLKHFLHLTIYYNLKHFLRLTIY